MTAADRGIVNHQLIVRATANGQALSQLVMTDAGAIELMMNVRHRMGLPGNGTAFSIAQTQRPSRDRKSVVKGKSVDHGECRVIKKTDEMYIVRRRTR